MNITQMLKMTSGATQRAALVLAVGAGVVRAQDLAATEISKIPLLIRIREMPSKPRCQESPAGHCHHQDPLFTTSMGSGSGQAAPPGTGCFFRGP